MKRKRRAAVAGASFKPYVRAWRQRLRQQARENERDRETAIQSARRVARLLARRYGARRVALIGSVLRPGAFRADSDIDVVAWGLKGLGFFRAWDDIESLLGRRVDLISGESATARVLNAVEEEGRYLYGEPS